MRKPLSLTGMALLALSVSSVLGPVLAAEEPVVEIRGLEQGSACQGLVKMTIYFESRSPNQRIEAILVEVDGRPFDEWKLDTPMFSGLIGYRWDTTVLGDGQHTLTVKARDEAGTTGVFSLRPVYINNAGPDKTPPLVRITRPQPQQIVSGKTQIQVEVSDNVGVKWVIFYVDDKFEALRNFPPFVQGWDTQKVANGPHELRAAAVDATGIHNESEPVQVMVLNPGNEVNPTRIQPPIQGKLQVLEPMDPRRPAPRSSEGPTVREVEEVAAARSRPLRATMASSTGVAVPILTPPAEGRSPRLFSPSGDLKPVVPPMAPVAPQTGSPTPPKRTAPTPSPSPPSSPPLVTKGTEEGLGLGSVAGREALKEAPAMESAAPRWTAPGTPRSRSSSRPLTGEVETTSLRPVVPEFGTAAPSLTRPPASRPVVSLVEQSGLRSSILARQEPLAASPRPRSAGPRATLEGGRLVVPTPAAPTALATAAKESAAATWPSGSVSAVLQTRAPELAAVQGGAARLTAPSGEVRGAPPRQGERMMAGQTQERTREVQLPAPAAQGQRISRPAEPVRLTAVALSERQAVKATRGDLQALLRTASVKVHPASQSPTSLPSRLSAPDANPSSRPQPPAFVQVPKGVPQTVGRVHVVAPGETLTAIARKYGATVDQIARVNRIRERNRIQVGQRLVIPGGQGVFFNQEPVSLDVSPFQYRGISVTPFRHIFEHQGGQVDWAHETKEVLAQDSERTIHLAIGSREAQVNEETMLMDLAAFIEQGRTMVPLRFIGEALDATIRIDPESGNIYITSNK